MRHHGSKIKSDPIFTIHQIMGKYYKNDIDRAGDNESGTSLKL